MPRKASPLSSSSVTLFGAIFLFTTWYVFCLECLVWFESLIFSLPQSSLLYTPFWRDTHESEFIRILYVVHLNLLWARSCSSASLVSFWARCSLVFLKKFSLASLKLIWEKEIWCSWSSLIFSWAFQNQHMKISPKVMDIQEGYNKNFHIDHWIW